MEPKVHRGASPRRPTRPPLVGNPWEAGLSAGWSDRWSPSPCRSAPRERAGARCADARRWPATWRPRACASGNARPWWPAQAGIDDRASRFAGRRVRKDRTLPSLHGSVPLAQPLERDEALLVGVEQTAHSGLIAGRLGAQGTANLFSRWKARVFWGGGCFSSFSDSRRRGGAYG